MNYLISILLFLQTPVRTQRPEVRALAAQFMCPCGCGRVTVNCDCGTAANMEQEIQSLLDKGFTPEQITNNFVAQYGESILAAPLKKGFNLSGYILPFLVAGVSIFLIFYILRTQRKTSQLMREIERQKLKEEEKKMIEKELEDME